MNVRISVVLTVLALIALLPSPIEAQATATWGWATARRSTTPSYAPLARDGDSRSHAAVQIQRFGAGDYSVVYPGAYNLVDAAGNSQATAISSSPRWCSALDWGVHSDPNNLQSTVRCYGYDGEAVDTQFSNLDIVPGAANGTMAYLWANNSTSASYTPDAGYQYNSTNATNTVTRLGTGRYETHLPGMSATEGNILVTSHEDATCKIGGWHVGGSSELAVDVNCYAPAGAAQDAQYSLLYIDGVGPTGVTGHSAAYLFADRPTTASYNPAAGYQFSSASVSATVKRVSTGVYKVTLPGMPKGGAVFVTAVGSIKARCQLTSIRIDGTPQKIGVACFGPKGSPADSKFMLAYTK